jgi:hypothetical protein
LLWIKKIRGQHGRVEGELLRALTEDDMSAGREKREKRKDREAGGVVGKEEL